MEECQSMEVRDTLPEEGTAVNCRLVEHHLWTYRLMHMRNVIYSDIDE